MNTALAQALVEVEVILSYTDKELVKKIPKSFWKFLEEHKDKHYTFEINEELPLEKQKIKEETKSLMALIYKDYFCTPEEKKEYNELLKYNQKKKEDEIAEKYSYDNLFKRKHLEQTQEDEGKIEQNTETALMDYSNLRWYKKAIFKIKDWFFTIFHKRKKNM